jgi:hypothetical protein
MFQRAFHRFHNAVDCSIFGVKKPVVLRAINSKVTIGNESADGKWEYKYYRSSKSSKSTSHANRCAFTYLLKQLSIFSPFPKCLRVEDVDENGDLRISHLSETFFFFPATFSSKSLTPLELKLNEAAAWSKLFPQKSMLWEESVPPHALIQQIASLAPQLSNVLYEDLFKLESSDTIENPQLPLSRPDSTSSSLPRLPPQTFSKSTQIENSTFSSTTSFDALPEKIVVDLPEGHYKGEVLNGVQHGHGVFIYANGDTYSGEWENGLAHGVGRMIYSNCGMYDGEWKAGQRHGIGLYIPLEDNVYVGEWRNNDRHGYGRQFSSTGKLLYDGQWANNERNGTGTAYFGKDESYVGEWRDGKMHGQGCWSRGDDNQLQWEGEWDDGVNKLGVWHLNTNMNSKISSFEELSIPSVFEQLNMQTRNMQVTPAASTEENDKSARAKVIVVHGVHPQDEIVIQYGN